MLHQPASRWGGAGNHADDRYDLYDCERTVQRYRRAVSGHSLHLVPRRRHNALYYRPLQRGEQTGHGAEASERADVRNPEVLLRHRTGCQPLYLGGFDEASTGFAYFIRYGLPVQYRGGERERLGRFWTRRK